MVTVHEGYATLINTKHVKHDFLIALQSYNLMNSWGPLYNTPIHSPVYGVVASPGVKR